METLSIMQHHDAMTGTHPFDVGLDYLKMMNQREDKALNISSVYGILAEDIFYLAKVHGIEL